MTAEWPSPPCAADAGIRPEERDSQWDLSPSGLAWALSAQKLCLGQTCRQTAGQTKKLRGGQAGGGEGSCKSGSAQRKAAHPQGLVSPGAWVAGAGARPGPRSGATSHPLSFCIKLEILNGLVLDAAFQLHHLVLKLNTAPIRGHRCRKSAGSGEAPALITRGRSRPLTHGSSPLSGSRSHHSARRQGGTRPELRAALFTSC